MNVVGLAAPVAAVAIAICWADAMKDYFALDIADDDPAGDDVFSEIDYLVLESEIALRETEHVRIANELRRLRVRLQQVEALLRRS